MRAPILLRLSPACQAKLEAMRFARLQNNADAAGMLAGGRSASVRLDTVLSEAPRSHRILVVVLHPRQGLGGLTAGELSALWHHRIFPAD
jgi:hypothetical protein